MLHQEPPPRDPQTSASFGFILAAISGMLSIYAWIQWWNIASHFKEASPHAVEGGMVFRMHFPVLAVEITSYAFGLPALIGLLSVVWRKPVMLGNWFFLAGGICLIPAISMVLTRFGFRIF